VDPARPEQAIADAAAACSNWGRWGDNDARGTLNLLTDDKRVEGARLVRRDGWGGYAGGPAPGLSFTCARWLFRTMIAAIATDTWGFEVRPNEFDDAFQPLHQVVIPHIGLFIGEMWDTEALAADCAADGRYDFWLTAAPIPVTGAVGAPVNPIAVK
jgi:kynurenine formamidase